MFVQKIEYTHQAIRHLIDILEKIIEYDEQVEQLTAKKRFLVEKKMKFQAFIQEQGPMSEDSHIVQEIRRTEEEIINTKTQINEKRQNEQKTGLELFMIIRFSKEKDAKITEALIRRKEIIIRKNKEQPEIQKFTETIFEDIKQIIVFLETVRNHAENILANITPLERTYEQGIMNAIGKGTLQSIGSKSTTVIISKIETGRREDTIKKTRRAAARAFMETPTQNLFIRSIEAYKRARDMGVQDEQITPIYQELIKSMPSRLTQ